MTERRKISAIVTDIEGTTSSIAFVKDVLFPYAERAIPDFVRANQHETEIAPLIKQACAEAGLPEVNIEAVIRVLLQWIKEDRKSTPLKAIQGHVWRRGYKAGHFQAHLYKDAYDMLKKWYAQGLPLYVYSSGSIQAQKLFFQHTERGNIAHWFNGHFDTTTGAKTDVHSYRKIAHVVGKPAAEILFLSDIAAELDAAEQAGIQTCWIIRHGQQNTGSVRRLTATDFYPIVV